MTLTRCVPESDGRYWMIGRLTQLVDLEWTYGDDLAWPQTAAIPGPDGWYDHFWDDDDKCYTGLAGVAWVAADPPPADGALWSDRPPDAQGLYWHRWNDGSAPTVWRKCPHPCRRDRRVFQEWENESGETYLVRWEIGRGNRHGIGGLMWSNSACFPRTRRCQWWREQAEVPCDE